MTGRGALAFTPFAEQPSPVPEPVEGRARDPAKPVSLFRSLTLSKGSRATSCSGDPLPVPE
ncbi:hypothetical protein PLANTIT3_61477 [Plantibacter sp. T3]|nr:hypothetical protein PLANTIT3_61477 [Plantibacter sp. T3]